jgi:hypothetical protein
MPELYRLHGTSKNANVTLILTDTHVIFEPSPAFRAHMEEGFTEARSSTQEAPGPIRWFVNKMMNVASSYIDQALAPHPIAEVEFHLSGDELEVKFGHKMWQMTHVKVDPSEAYIFDAKLRAAKQASQI